MTLDGAGGSPPAPRFWPPALLEGVAAVDGGIGAGDEPAVVAGEESDEAGDIVGLTKAAQGRRVGDPGFLLRRLMGVGVGFNEPRRNDMEKTGVPTSWMFLLGVLKAAGAIGLAVGFFIPVIGTAAAIGLVCYFVAAIITHVWGRNWAFGMPVVFLLIATSALWCRLLVL